MTKNQTAQITNALIGPLNICTELNYRLNYQGKTSIHW